MINGALVQAFSLSVSLSLSVSINAVTTQRVPPLWPSQKKKKRSGTGSGSGSGLVGEERRKRHGSGKGVRDPCRNIDAHQLIDGGG